MSTIYTVADAIEMMRNGGVDFASELSNIGASYADITDEIKQAGGEPDFDLAAYEIALRANGPILQTSARAILPGDGETR